MKAILILSQIFLGLSLSFFSYGQLQNQLKSYGFESFEIIDNNEYLSSIGLDVLIARRTDYIDENNLFEVNDSTQYYYDENGYFEKIVHLLWDGNVWNNWLQTFYEFDENGNRLLIHRQEWDSISWISRYQYIYEYDDNDNQLYQKRELWNNDQWENSFLNTYTYSENNLIEALNQEWEFNAWQNLDVISFELNDFGLPSASISKRWIDGEWTTLYQTEYSYDNAQNLILTERERLVDENWEANRKVISEYNEQNSKTEEVIQSGQENQYINSTRRKFIFDDDEKLSEDFFYSWSDTSWTNINMRKHEYDERDNQVYRLSYTWNNAEWIHNNQTFYYYNLLSSTKNLHSFNSQSEIVPNPNQGEFTLKLPTVDLQNLQVDIFDLNGKTVFHSTLVNAEEEIKFSIPWIKTGLYILNVQGKDISLSEKISVID